MKQTRDLMISDPSSVVTDISSIFLSYDLPQSTIEDLTTHLAESPRVLDFLMQFQHTLVEPSGSRAIVCALTIALGYFIGGFVPLLPYLFLSSHEALTALWWSVGIMTVALFIFGYGKTCYVVGWRGSGNVRQGTVGGLQMVLVGGVAAGSAMGLVKVFHSLSSDA